jgi:hypothetical protein
VLTRSVQRHMLAAAAPQAEVLAEHVTGDTEASAAKLPKPRIG